MVYPLIGSILVGFVTTLTIQNIYPDSLKLNKIKSANQTSNVNEIDKESIGEVLSNQIEATSSQFLDYIVITETPKPTLTPKPTSTPRPTPISPSDLDALFTKYSNSQSINYDLLKKIAYCESRFNPNAVNGDYVGLFQYSKNTWINTRRKLNLDPDPALRFNPEESVKTAAFTMAINKISSWPNCSK